MATKVIVVVRQDNELTSGQLCVHAMHALVEALDVTPDEQKKKWIDNHRAIVMLTARDKYDLERVRVCAHKRGVHTHIYNGIRDGHKYLMTILGPGDEYVLNDICTGLRLYHGQNNAMAFLEYFKR